MKKGELDYIGLTEDKVKTVTEFQCGYYMFQCC